MSTPALFDVPAAAPVVPPRVNAGDQGASGGPLVTAGMARELAVTSGVCARPLLQRLTDRATGDTRLIPMPCGSTRSVVCPACAEKARRVRMTQCAEGWHRDDDPLPDPGPAAAGDDEHQGDDDGEQPATGDDDENGRRSRSTRRRQDATDLPRVPAEHRSIGRAFTGKDGKVYRPSMFVTLTLPSYGKIITGTGVPADPDSYDYRRAALDALHFPKLVDRWVQNLRRCAGFKVQYFAAVEPQKRLAPHLHAAIRGAIPRDTLRAVTKATYVQVWWPAHDDPVYTGTVLPVWDGRDYLDPTTGEPLPTWDQALDALDADDDARPVHTMRAGSQLDARGIIAPSAHADRAVRYLTKYLTKATADAALDDSDGNEPDPGMVAHVDRLHSHLRWLPCSPGCSNWLRYGVQPKDPTPGLVPGRCASKAHDREHLGLGGRRVLVSRSWSGKTLADHKADRAEVVRQTLAAAGMETPDTDRCAADVTHTDGGPRFIWEHIPVTTDAYAATVLASITERQRWRSEYDHARTVATQRAGPVDNRSATTNDEGAAA